MLHSPLLTDSSLHVLARRLRFLGYDVEVDSGATLEEILERGAREHRTVITASVRHPRRHAHVQALHVPHHDPDAALRLVVETHEPAGPPLSRCSRCNAVLHVRATAAAHDIPERVRARFDRLRHCERCDAWYWPGSHVPRIRESIERALGPAGFEPPGV